MAKMRTCNVSSHINITILSIKVTIACTTFSHLSSLSYSYFCLVTMTSSAFLHDDLHKMEYRIKQFELIMIYFVGLFETHFIETQLKHHSA